MPLIKAPLMTSRKLAANRANALRSPGPRTPEGKRHVMLNALRHGRCSRAFRSNLVKAGENVQLFDWIHDRFREAFPVSTPRQDRAAELVAREVWCALRRSPLSPGSRPRPHQWPARRASLWSSAWTPWRFGGLATKPRYAVKSVDSAVTYLSQILAPFDFAIVDPHTNQRLKFWVRRRRGTRVTIPLDAFPEIAAWRLGLTPALETCGQARSRESAIMPSWASAPGLPNLRQSRWPGASIPSAGFSTRPESPRLE